MNLEAIKNPPHFHLNYLVDTVSDFLIKLGIKPIMHLVEISIFSLNNVTVRPTKIMNRADKIWAHLLKVGLLDSPIFFKKKKNCKDLTNFQH